MRETEFYHKRAAELLAMADYYEEEHKSEIAAVWRRQANCNETLAIQAELMEHIQRNLQKRFWPRP
jgi:hypothetical protein